MSSPEETSYKFIVKRHSDTEALVRFPQGLRVGENINFELLLTALLTYRSPILPKGDDTACCGYGEGACCSN